MTCELSLDMMMILQSAWLSWASEPFLLEQLQKQIQKKFPKTDYGGHTEPFSVVEQGISPAVPHIER